MITPFAEASDTPGIVSYGLSSFGYDMRLAPVFKGLHQAYRGVLDCKNLDPKLFWEVEGNYCDVPPNSILLGVSVESFRIPRNLAVTVLGKSTYARCGLVVNVTPMEPEWVGQLTLELSNTTPLPIRVYANEGIAQALFLAGEEPERSYADKKGKYQYQQGITFSKIRE
jgi:dCTP deaminase